MRSIPFAIDKSLTGRERSTEFDYIDLMLFADVRPNVCSAKALVVDKHGTDRMELLILSLRTRLP